MAEVGKTSEIKDVLARHRSKKFKSYEIHYLIQWKGNKRESWESVNFMRKNFPEDLKEFYTWVHKEGLVSYNVAKPEAKKSPIFTHFMQKYNQKKNVKNSNKMIDERNKKSQNKIAPKNTINMANGSFKHKTTTISKAKIVPFKKQNFTNLNSLQKNAQQTINKYRKQTFDLNRRRGTDTRTVSPGNVRKGATLTRSGKGGVIKVGSFENRATSPSNRSGATLTRSTTPISIKLFDNEDSFIKRKSAKKNVTKSKNNVEKNECNSKVTSNEGLTSNSESKRLIKSELQKGKELKNSRNINRSTKKKKTIKKSEVNRKDKSKNVMQTAIDINLSSESDSDTLYSLGEIFPTPAKKMRVELVDVRKSPMSSRCSTPILGDGEVSFKLSSPAKKILLKDSVKMKQGQKSDEVYDSRLSTGWHWSSSLPIYKQEKLLPGTPLSSPSTTPTKTAEEGFASSIPVMPLLHNSPAACYKSLMKNLKNLQADRGLKNKKNGNECEPIERRTSVRQSESVFKYKEIIVKKCAGYTQIWLFSQNVIKNSLSPQAMSEVIQALHNAKYDDSRLVMLAGTGSVFCSGIDLSYVTATSDHKLNAKKLSDTLKEFLGVLISFPKPIVAAVNGSAVGLGVTMLPLCDIVYASDKASFYCPYTRLNQTPEGCSSFTFPQVMGGAMANEMLLGGRKITATEACQVGLVSQVFWPEGMMQSVMLKLQQMAQHSAKSLEASKLLIRSHQKSKLEFTCESECNLLCERWASPDCIKAHQTYLDKEQDFLL